MPIIDNASAMQIKIYEYALHIKKLDSFLNLVSCSNDLQLTLTTDSRYLCHANRVHGFYHYFMSKDKCVNLNLTQPKKQILSLMSLRR